MIFVVELVVVENFHVQPVLALQSAWLRRSAHAQAYVFGVTVVCDDTIMTKSPIMNKCLIIFFMKIS